MSKESKITFQAESNEVIRVLDSGELVALIEWASDIGELEFNTLDGQHVFWTEDLYLIANYMSKLSI